MNFSSILIVLPTASMGGAERVMYNLAHHLLSQGAFVTVYFMSRGRGVAWEALESNLNANFIYKEFASEKASLCSLFFELFILSRRRNFDYVISTHTHVNAVLSFLVKIGFLKCERLISRESTFIFERFHGLKRILFYALYKFFYGAQDVLICQTEGMKSSLLRSLGFEPSKKIIVVPNPINLQDVLFKTQISAVGDVGFRRLVACGRLVPIKSFDLLLRAYASLYEKYNDCVLYIIGDGPSRLALECLVEELGIASRVFFLGNLINPLPWFVDADVGIVSSEREGFPNVLIEMMASGTKCVITTPCSDGVFDLPGVVITKDHSVDSLVECISKALDRADDFREIYRSYIFSERNINSFWLKVVKASV